MNLLSFAHNTFSQMGEDGITSEVLRLVGTTANPCAVDVGAGDGVLLSNTRQVVACGWSSVQIEGNPERYRLLHDLYRDRADVTTICAAVGWGQGDSIDALLDRHAPQTPPVFDLFSLDVDGTELSIWYAMKKYRPRLVWMEHNPMWPHFIVRTQAQDPAVNKGASLAATVELGRTKGYELVCCTAWNALFVTAELYPLIPLDPVAPNDIRVLGSHYPQYRSWRAWDYDGTEHAGGPQHCIWPTEDGKYAGRLDREG